MNKGSIENAREQREAVDMAVMSGQLVRAAPYPFVRPRPISAITARPDAAAAPVAVMLERGFNHEKAPENCEKMPLFWGWATVGRVPSPGCKFRFVARPCHRDGDAVERLYEMAGRGSRRAARARYPGALHAGARQIWIQNQAAPGAAFFVAARLPAVHPAPGGLRQSAATRQRLSSWSGGRLSCAR